MIPLALPDGGWEVIIDPAWPGFAGHFPGDPIVPAALLVQWALAIAGPAAELTRARFVAPVRPGDRVVLTRADSTRGMVVVARCDQRTVAELLFAPT
mgnify:CR=1 FL=1